jgi:hypothetical protein
VSYVQLGSTLENSQGFNILTLDIFKLYRNFWDFAFENPEKIKPNHIAIFSFAIEHCNRLGWKKKFGLPSTMTMEAVGIKSYNTYISAFNELVQYGFIELIEKSKNQYSSNIIALSNNFKANDKALDKAFIKHTTKQDESTIQSTGESISSINIQETNLPINKITIEDRKLKFADTLKPFLETYGKDLLNDFYNYWTEPNHSNTKMKFELNKTWSIEGRLRTWAKNDKNFNKDKQTITTQNYPRI